MNIEYMARRLVFSILARASKGFEREMEKQKQRKAITYHGVTVNTHERAEALRKR